jgi:hypothetical protein
MAKKKAELEAKREEVKQKRERAVEVRDNVETERLERRKIEIEGSVTMACGLGRRVESLENEKTSCR